MLPAILEAATTLGPIVLLMLTPVLIPIFTIGASTLFDRRRKATA